MQVNLKSLGVALLMGNFLAKLQDVPLDSIIDLFKKFDFLTKMSPVCLTQFARSLFQKMKTAEH